MLRISGKSLSIAARVILLAAAAFVFNACAFVDRHLPTTAELIPKKGRARIVIDLSEQRARLYKGTTVAASARISTGREGYRTPAGNFRVTQKSRHHRSSLYGDYVDRSGRIVKANVDVRKHPKPKGVRFVGAPMPYFLRFNGSIGMHAGEVPNYPASHGCVRLPPRMARTFYRMAKVGTPVKVVR